MNLEEARQEFARIQKRIAAMDYAIELLFLDGETVAPPKSATNRVTTVEILNEELYNLKFGEETAAIMDQLLEHEDQLTLVESRSIEVLKRTLNRLKNVPKEEYVKQQSLITAARNAWHIASEEDNYEILCPHLEKVYDNIRGFAKEYNPEMNPYDYCLDAYEPGSNTELYDKLFDGVRRDIVPLLREIREKPQVDDSCLMGDYSVEKQEKLSLYIMELMGLDLNRVGLATAEHPIARRLGSHFDERITTRYSRKDFTFSLYNILFGCGFTLSEMGQEDDVAYTVADGSASIGIMEGQTRFYEHIIGRSRPFIHYIYPKLKSLFPTSIKDSSPEDLYLAVNKVSPGPIRIGSDEITNSLHILVRYELEKALINKELSFKDLPQAWNEKYMEYLGVEVKNNNQGVLQDMLWADGAMGYFPTAVLGNTYSALMREKMSQDIDIEACVREGNIACINEWNREHVWKYIGLYDPGTIMERFLGVDSVDSSAHVEYLKKKYSGIYKL